MPKNICLILNSLSSIGGVERVTLSLAKGFSKLGHRVDIIALNEIKDTFSHGKFKFNIHSIKREKYPIRQVQDAKNAKNLQKKIIDIGVNFDLIVANTTETSRVCKRLNMPHTYYAIMSSISGLVNRHHGQKKIPKLRKKIRALSMKILYKNLNIITVSKGVEQDLIEFGIRPKTVQTIYPPFDFDNIKKQSKEYQIDERNYIIHVGRFSPEKRYDILIHAYKKANIKQKLLLLGDGNKKDVRNVKQLVANLNLEDKIIFKGLVTNPLPYIKNARVLVLSSDFEGLPTVLIEALILKIPVVSTNCPSGPSEILIGELKPFLSPVENINALAKNIKKMTNKPIEITNKYTDKFSTEKSIKKYLTLCN